MAQARIGRTPDLERIMDQSMTNDFALYLGRFGQMYACRPATHSALPVPCSAPLLGAPLILCAYVRRERPQVPAGLRDHPGAE